MWICWLQRHWWCRSLQIRCQQLIQWYQLHKLFRPYQRCISGCMRLKHRGFSVISLQRWIISLGFFQGRLIRPLSLIFLQQGRHFRHLSLLKIRIRSLLIRSISLCIRRQRRLLRRLRLKGRQQGRLSILLTSWRRSWRHQVGRSWSIKLRLRLGWPWLIFRGSSWFKLIGRKSWLPIRFLSHRWWCWRLGGLKIIWRLWIQWRLRQLILLRSSRRSFRRLRLIDLSRLWCFFRWMRCLGWINRWMIRYQWFLRSNSQFKKSIRLLSRPSCYFKY